MAFPFYIKVHGSRQGDFKGDTLNPRRLGWIDGRDFELEVESPRDQATGQASGKRQWKPIAIIKQWSASSPQFLQALVTNELLPSVTIEFESLLANGTEATYYAVRLTNASVAQVRQYIGSVREKQTEILELERIELTFQKIVIEYTDGQIMFSDDWLE